MRRISFFLPAMLVIVLPHFVTTTRDDSSNFHQWKTQHYRRSTSNPHPKGSSSRRAHLRSPTYSYNTYKSKKPNIILLMTDDQDVELGSLNFMSETTRLLREGGAEFRHAYATTPMCCPSRSSMLTGLYVHNHNVYTNNDNCSNIQWQMEHETRSFATYLHDAGYHTGYFGKYLNKYNGTYTPPGWKEWGGLIMNSKYYNYSINMNGKRIRHGDDYYKDYYTDLVANDSVNFLRQWKTWNSDKPTLLVMSFPAPHGPEDSAPQFSNMFLNVTTHHTPTYDYAPNPDKQWILQVTGKMMPIHKQFTDLLMAKRLQTLQSVDHAVKRVYDVLKETNELENTYIIYTSDHGYHLGQFGLIKGKSFPFEFDVRIPFLVRGPGIKPGSIVNEIALNIDLAPTILDVAGIQIPSHMDGRSLVKLFHKKKRSSRKQLLNWPDTFLIESSGRRDALPNSNLLSNKRILFSSTESSSTSSSPVTDVEESTSSWSNSLPASSTETPEIVVDETAELNTVKSYSFAHVIDADTSTKEIPPNNDFHENALLSSKAERLSLECQLQEYSVPCDVGQKWYCVLKDNRWRKHKCRSSTRKLPLPTNLQKCTCITEEGILYMRFQTVNERSEPKRFIYNRRMEKIHPAVVHYLKSNKSSDELVNELAKTWKIMKRYRRNSLLEKDNKFNAIPIVDVIDGQMIELPVLNNQTNSTTCTVSYDGSIRCSPEMYDNPAVLRTMQENIRLLIRKLQIQVKKLKSIQRHLEKKQPFITNGVHAVDQDSENKRSDIGQNQRVTNYTDLLSDGLDESKSSETTSAEMPAKHKHRHEHTDLPADDTLRAKEKQSSDNSVPDTCYCIPHSEEGPLSTEAILKEQKRRLKEQRIKKKERKLKKKAKLEKECSQEKMNCFNHDNQHWKTPPYWTEGPFCFCMNANNNTYNCIRTINATHNFLYCEFITGLMTFYNLRIDPFQQWNRFNSLSKNEKSFLQMTLAQMLKCKGTEECGFHGGARHQNSDSPSFQNKVVLPSDRKHLRRNITRTRGD